MLEFAARAVEAALTQENPRRYECAADPFRWKLQWKELRAVASINALDDTGAPSVPLPGFRATTTSEHEEFSF